MAALSRWRDGGRMGGVCGGGTELSHDTLGLRKKNSLAPPLSQGHFVIGGFTAVESRPLVYRLEIDGL